MILLMLPTMITTEQSACRKQVKENCPPWHSCIHESQLHLIINIEVCPECKNLFPAYVPLQMKA